MTGTWHYQILHHNGEHPYFALHEVFDFGGKPTHTENPVTFSCHEHEGSEGLVKSLRMALDDATAYPILEVSDDRP